MKYLTLSQLYCTVIALLFLTLFPAYGDFHTPDKPSFSLTGGGIQHIGNFDASGAIPLKFIDGYVGVRYLRDGIPDDETSRTHLRARIEGGKQWGRVGLRAYGRYGRESAMIEKGLYHGGANVEVDLFQRGDLRAIVGVGTWAERREILEEYLETVSEQGVNFGPRAHLTLRDTNWTVNSAFLLHSDKTYQIRSFFDVEIPLFKLLFIEQVSLVGTGHVGYYSQTYHVDVDNLQWNWSKTLRVKF